MNSPSVALLVLGASLLLGLAAGSIINHEAERSRAIHGGERVPGTAALQLLSAIVAIIITSRGALSFTTIPHLVFGLALVAVSTIDWCQHRIPTMVIRPVFCGCAALLGIASLSGQPGSLTLAGLGAASFCGLLWFVHHLRPTGMGMGDVRLSALLGLFIGWASTDWPQTGQRLGTALFLASLFGLALAAITHLKTGSGSTPVALGQVQIPFGPALSLGTGLVVFAPL